MYCSDKPAGIITYCALCFLIHFLLIYILFTLSANSFLLLYFAVTLLLYVHSTLVQYIYILYFREVVPRDCFGIFLS